MFSDLQKRLETLRVVFIHDQGTYIRREDGWERVGDDEYAYKKWMVIDGGIDALIEFLGS